MTDAGRTNKRRRTLKIELLSQWKLEAEFRNCEFSVLNFQVELRLIMTLSLFICIIQKLYSDL